MTVKTKNQDVNAISVEVVKANVIDSSALNLVGEALGYDWNDVCDEVQKHEFYGDSGDQGIDVRKIDLVSIESEMLKNILTKIFESNPQLKSLLILN